MHVAITGGSSLTGSKIAGIYNEQGWDVSVLFTKPSLDEYSPLQQMRIKSLVSRAHFGLRVEDGSYAKWINDYCPDLWIHHHHYMNDFRSRNYDYGKSYQIGIGCSRVIYSGTYFEEPKHDIIRNFNLYVVSKMQAWGKLLELCTERGIHIGKVVIPNVIDPLENRDRALPQFFLDLMAGRQFQLRSPINIIDCLPAWDLARSYFELSDQLLQKKISIVRPSGWRGKMCDWLAFANFEIGKRLNRPLIKISESRQEEATAYYNTEKIHIDWDIFWDQYVEAFDHHLL
jgi:hypothetical protein